MIADKELREYQNLCALSASLYEKFAGRKEELRLLLNETRAARKTAFSVLAKANGFTRHLTGRQRQTAGFPHNHLGELKARINRCGPRGSGRSIRRFPDAAGGEIIFGDSFEKDDFAYNGRENFSGKGELRRKELSLLRLIDATRKKLLQLDLLELRCRELILSINKAMEAFLYEWKLFRKKLYPFGVFSFCRRLLRRLAGKPYFSPGDMGDITVMGTVTLSVLKIADSPIL